MDALIIAGFISAFFAALAGIESAWRWCNRECDRVLGDR
jgi:hypothetical protein